MLKDGANSGTTMNTMAVSTRMIPVLLPVYAAGVPTTAARGGLLIPTEFKFNVAEVSTFQATVHLPMHPEDIPDTHFSKIRILPQSDRIGMTPGDGEEITVTVKNIGKRTISIDPTVIVSPYRGYVFDDDRIVMGPAIAELETYSGGMFSFAVGISGDAERGHYNVQVAFTDECPFPDVPLTGQDGSATPNFIAIRGSVNLGGSDIPLRRVCCGRQEGTNVYYERRGGYREHYMLPQVPRLEAGNLRYPSLRLRVRVHTSKSGGWRVIQQVAGGKVDRRGLTHLSTFFTSFKFPVTT